MSKDKALVKKTGETKEVKSKYSVKYMTMSFNFDLGEGEEMKEMKFVHDSEPKEEGDYYTLEDGKTYHQKDVVVGTDEIRDHKLKNII